MRLVAEDIIGCIDSREQRPLCLDPMKVVTKKLEFCDYTFEGGENFFVVEKKSLTDLCACVGRERERFTRMLERTKHVPHKALVVTSDWANVDMKQYPGILTPKQIKGTVYSWWFDYGFVPIFVSNETRAGREIVNMMVLAANRLRRATQSPVPDPLRENPDEDAFSLSRSPELR